MPLNRAIAMAKAGGAARRRRLTGTAAFGDAMDDRLRRQRDHEHEVETQWLMGQVNAKPDLLRVCRIAIEAREMPQEVEERVARGVRFLENTPDYICRKTLIEISGMGAGEVASLNKDDLRALFKFVFGDEKGLKVPELEMLLADYMEWLKTRRIQKGRRLEGYKWKIDEELDWEFEIGQYSITGNPDADMDAVDVGDGDYTIEFIKNNVSGEVKKLPDDLVLASKFIGVKWTLVNNFSDDKVVMLNIRTDKNFNITKHCQGIVAEDAQTPSRPRTQRSLSSLAGSLATPKTSQGKAAAQPPLAKAAAPVAVASAEVPTTASSAATAAGGDDLPPGDPAPDEV